MIKTRHIDLDYITINKMKWGQFFLYCVILSVGLVNNLGQSVGLILGLIVGQCLGLDVGFSMVIEVMEGMIHLTLPNFLINTYIVITTTKTTKTTEISKRKIIIQSFFLSGNRYTSYGCYIGGTDENKGGTHLALTIKSPSTLYITDCTSTPP